MPGGRSAIASLRSFFILPVLLACACTADDPPPGRASDASPSYFEPSPSPGPPRSARVSITWVAPRPEIGSGTVISWYKFTARSIGRGKPGRNRTYFRIYLGDRDVLPVAGETCDIVYRFREINGFGVGGDGLIRRGRVGEKLACFTAPPA